MRTEHEMFELIINIAKQDERIRAVYMNGSRTNSKVPKDIFQDYDIVYVVSTIETDYSTSVGKSGKYMYRFLSKEIWRRFLSTYPDGNVEHIWKATFVMCDIFDEVAKEVADKLGYCYNQEEATASSGFLEHVHGLSKDVKEIY